MLANTFVNEMIVTSSNSSSGACAWGEAMIERGWQLWLRNSVSPGNRACLERQLQGSRLRNSVLDRHVLWLASPDLHHLSNQAFTSWRAWKGMTLQIWRSCAAVCTCSMHQWHNKALFVLFSAWFSCAHWLKCCCALHCLLDKVCYSFLATLGFCYNGESNKLNGHRFGFKGAKPV